MKPAPCRPDSAAALASRGLAACGAGDGRPRERRPAGSDEPGIPRSAVGGAHAGRDAVPGEPRQSPTDRPDKTPTPDTTPTQAPAGTTIVRAYFFLGSFVDNPGLVPVLREVPTTQAVGAAAMPPCSRARTTPSSAPAPRCTRRSRRARGSSAFGSRAASRPSTCRASSSRAGDRPPCSVASPRSCTR